MKIQSILMNVCAILIALIILDIATNLISNLSFNSFESNSFESNSFDSFDDYKYNKYITHATAVCRTCPNQPTEYHVLSDKSLNAYFADNHIETPVNCENIGCKCITCR